MSASSGSPRAPNTLPLMLKSEKSMGYFFSEANWLPLGFAGYAASVPLIEESPISQREGHSCTQSEHMPEQDELSGVRSLVELKPELMLGLYDISIICLSYAHYRMMPESLSNGDWRTEYAGQEMIVFSCLS